jgi:peptide/nickel transport system substrate-binding protein
MDRRTLLKGAAASLLAAPAVAQPAKTATLRFVPQANLTLLDPIFTTAAVTANHAWMVYDTLFGVNAALQPKPQMAEGYAVSDNGRTCLIKLRDGLKWHDGERYARRTARRASHGGRRAIRSGRPWRRPWIPGAWRTTRRSESR